MNFLKLTEKNSSLLNIFLKSLKEELKTFRYYLSRDISIFKTHPYTCLLMNKNQPIGYGHIDFEDKKHWIGIVIREDFQRRGLGKKMMSHLLKIAKKKEIDKLYLSCDKTNEKAILLYKKIGFSFFKKNKDAVFMSKNIVF